MKRSDIEAVIVQYEKHDWRLRRILLTDQLRTSLGPDVDVFRNAEIVRSDLDAAWFSRASRPGKETWELRRIAPAPFALDAFLSDDLSSEENEEILLNTEMQMRATGVSNDGH